MVHLSAHYCINHSHFTCLW